METFPKVIPMIRYRNVTGSVQGYRSIPLRTKDTSPKSTMHSQEVSASAKLRCNILSHHKGPLRAGGNPLAFLRRRHSAGANVVVMGSDPPFAARHTNGRSVRTPVIGCRRDNVRMGVTHV